ncbi:MAG: hypothetical protein R3248_08955, partial [Candidatus Promineifilaceae bacterium]|nr:hypothetical protein [Candidatus Promineifilaceae bacterium]
TAPLWTLMLAVGYLLRAPFLLWTFLLGTVSLIWLVWVAMALWRRLWPQQAARAWIPGLVLAFSWPLIWAAASGMETALFLALAVTLLLLYARLWAVGEEKGETRQPLWLGAVSGLLVLVRPEGVLLILLLVVGLIVGRRFRSVVVYGLGAAIPLLPYFLFNLSLSGQLWPNTFYAKQAEYTVLLERPLPARTLNLLYFSLGGPAAGWRGMTGARLLLVPGLVAAGWLALRRDWSQRRLLYTLPLLWAGGHVFAYAWRLPVTYQHGRYLWPALPVWILYGLAGSVHLLGRWRGRRDRLFSRVAALTFFVVLAIFLLLGAQAYATDVDFIQREMVDVASWLRDNTPPDALIAAHDIGAIGYFAQRPILDLAGLISPEVTPLLSDEAAMARYVRASDARYLVTAPGWPYPLLTDAPDTTLLYTTDYAWTREQGLNNMAVYRLPSS